MLHPRPSVKTRPLAKSLAKLSSVAAIFSALAASTASGQTVTWDAGSGADFLWNTLTNWSGDVLPTATDAVIFPTPIPNPGTLATPGTITLGAGEVALSLDLQSAYTLTGGDLTLGAGGTTNVGGAVSATVNSALLGANGVTKTGTGTLILSGANTFTGATAVNAGILNIQSATALGTVAGGVTVASGAELQIQGAIAVGAEALTIAGTGTTTTSGALHNISGTNSYAGAVTIDAAGALITSDAGTLTLGSTINGAAAASPLSFGGAGAVTVTGAIGANVGTVSKSGAGTVTLSAAGSQTGTTSITGGRIAATNLSALGAGAVSVAGATSVYEINAAAGTSVQAVNVSNGGTFQWTQNAQLTLGPALGFSGTGGTIFVGGSGSK
jgi:autotransporter-associated beta strand protein